MQAHKYADRPSRVMIAAAVIVTSVAAVLITYSAPASGLSCVEMSDEEVIARTTVPFIGRVISESASESGLIATYQVEESFRVDLPAVVDVHIFQPSDSAPSGVVLANPGPGGVLWADFGGCTPRLEPDLVRSYYQPLPSPSGEGPLRFLVGSKLGGARVVALDADAETLAYGFGAGDLGAVTVCPDGRTAVEMVLTSVGSGKFDVTMEVRDLKSMDVVGVPRKVRSAAHASRIHRPEPFVSGFTCHTPNGEDVSYLYP